LSIFLAAKAAILALGVIKKRTLPKNTTKVVLHNKKYSRKFAAQSQIVFTFSNNKFFKL
jgi:hypothetical protein